MGSPEVRRLITDLEQVPKSLRRELGARLRKAAQPIQAEARRNASWSSRIPGAITMRTRFSGKKPGVMLRVNARAAPHARAYEGLTSRGTTFRHPTFGHRDRWVTQAERPFLFPAADRHADNVVEAVGEAIDASARLHGWR